MSKFMDEIRYTRNVKKFRKYLLNEDAEILFGLFLEANKNIKDIVENELHLIDKTIKKDLIDEFAARDSIIDILLSRECELIEVLKNVFAVTDIDETLDINDVKRALNVTKLKLETIDKLKDMMGYFNVLIEVVVLENTIEALN